jgi:hypothetical protein
MRTMNAAPLSPRPGRCLTGRLLPYGWFCLLLALLFIARGQAVLQLYPAMEGFDEFQHTAYLIHLEEQGTLPVLGETLVPKSLHPELAANPHSDLSWRQAREAGGLRYKHFYDHAAEPVLDRDILLFQAQHPPLYYLFTHRLFGAIYQTAGYREAVYALRSLQLVFGAAALVLMLLTFRRLIEDPLTLRLAALAASLVPMNLIYTLRVSNDALAVLFASAMFAVLAGIRTDRHLVTRAAALGLLAAAGAMTKTIAFLFLPVAIAFYAALLFARSFSRIKVLIGLVLIPAIYTALCHRYHLDNLERHGTLFPALETIVNAENHHGLGALLGAARLADVWDFFVIRLVQENLWKSGMTFLEPWSGWEWAAFAILAAGLLGGLADVLRATSRTTRLSATPDQRRYLLLCGLAVGATFAGAYAHGLNCRLAWGALITPAYYVMVAFPALIVVCLAGLRPLAGRTAAIVLSGGLCLIYLAAELHALITVAIPYWTNTRDPALAITRLRQLGNAWTDPWSAAVWWAGAAALLAVLFRQLQIADAETADDC